MTGHDRGGTAPTVLAIPQWQGGQPHDTRDLWLKRHRVGRHVDSSQADILVR